MSQQKIFCFPGDRLCMTDDHTVASKGTFTKGSYIYSSLVGHVQVIQSKDERVIEVAPNNDVNKRIPAIGDIIVCKVDKITTNNAKCSIYGLPETFVSDPFKALIRKEDVREKLKDTVEISKYFRPGDIIKCRVIGTSDYGYLLSTIGLLPDPE